MEARIGCDGQIHLIQAPERVYEGGYETRDIINGEEMKELGGIIIG